MTSASLPRDALMPRRADGLGVGLLLALLAHALLIVALAFGIDWHTREPAGIEAELWAAVPQAAAPRAAEPEPPAPTPPPKPVPRAEPQAPPQPDAQIAVEKARREDEQRLREEEKQRKLEEAQRAKEEQERKRKDDDRLAALREENMRRMMGQAGATGAPTDTGSAARSAGPSATYGGRVIARLRPLAVFADSVAGNPKVEVRIRVAPDGTITGKDVVRTSGVPAWDEAVLRAIEKAERLPRDVDGRVPDPIVVTWGPKD